MLVQRSTERGQGSIPNLAAQCGDGDITKSASADDSEGAGEFLKRKELSSQSFYLLPFFLIFRFWLTYAPPAGGSVHEGISCMPAIHFGKRRKLPTLPRTPVLHSSCADPRHAADEGKRQATQSGSVVWVRLHHHLFREKTWQLVNRQGITRS